MKIEKMLLKDMVPYDRNPRKNDQAVDRVLESLKSSGYVAPIIVSEIGHPFKERVICAGHTRWKALKKFGSEEVDVVVHKFDSEEHFIRYNIQDNKSGEFAEWDEKILAQLETEFEIDLADMGFDLKGFGDGEDDIKDLSGSLEVKYEIAVECGDEKEQETKYNELIKMGFKCRLLTL